jgi:endonuclease YncB( thermonuclease family)
MKPFKTLLLTSVLASAGFAQAANKFEFEDVCGSPAVESQIFPKRSGIVAKIIDGDTVEVKDGYGKVWIVELAGVGSVDGNDEAKVYLTKNVLDKKVDFHGNPDKTKDPIIEAMLVRKGVDINRYLIENGLAKYRETEYGYAVSNYELCVLDKLETRARLSRVGIWTGK